MSNRIQTLALVVLGVPVLLLALSATANADTIHVCWDGSGDYLSIQEGIDAASDGDEVVVCDGTYTGSLNKNLDFGGKAITLRSASGDAALCIIDCGGDGRGFYYHHGETAASIVDGFTITNGYAEYGEGGGAIHCRSGSSPTITNCTISGNMHGYLYGGAVCCFADSHPTITNCAISGNWAYFGGGGVYCAYNSSPTLTNCTISGNWGGYGGGVYCYEYSSPTITNCTISCNWAGWGGGVCSKGYSSPTLTNCIVWGNLPMGQEEIGGDAVVTYSDVWGGWPGTGNIDADPLFVDLDGPDDDPNTWEDNDYHLGTDSPCIDTGDPDFVAGPDERDIDGQMRVWDGDDEGEWIVDMGSDEFGSIIPGDLDADGCVGHGDLGILLSSWGCSGGDLNGDGTTNQADLGILLAHWGEGCP